jgi:branched-chain amino acid transport system ATP-binding protein
MAPLLAGGGISKRFGGLQVLDRVDFRVDAGEIVALIGPNGAGKTTLFNVVSGLVRPEAGRVSLDGHDITRAPVHELSGLGIGRTFQTPRPFLPMTAVASVAIAARFAARPGPPPHEALRLVGLGADETTPVGRLPPARRKRVELAMVLAQSPRVILLDEILGGLTPAETADLTRLLRGLRDERGIALYWIDHVMGALMDAADRVIVLHHGEVIAEGAPGAVARDARVVEAYLGRAPAA